MAGVAADRTAGSALLTRLFAVLGLALAAIGFGPIASSQAAGCSSTSGVSVVVQFPSGSVSTGCASGSYGTALDALTAAGFQPTRAARVPGYFLCRINGQPSSDPCQQASPASAYWSLWTGRPGSGWSYATNGIASQPAPQGSSIGLRWGAGSAPSVRPVSPAPKPSPSPKPTTKPTPKPTTKPAPRPTTAAPKPTTAPHSTSAPRPSSSQSSAAGPSSAPATTSGSSTAGASGSSGSTGSTSSSAGSTSTTTSGSSTSTGPSDTTQPSDTQSSGGAQPSGTDVAAGPKKSDSGSGSSAGLLAGGGLVVVLLAGAGYLALRRRAS